jgi:hypothetical protein
MTLPQLPRLLQSLPMPPKTAQHQRQASTSPMPRTRKKMMLLAAWPLTGHTAAVHFEAHVSVDNTTTLPAITTTTIIPTGHC